MCVILVCEDMAPCEEENPQGAGIAWRERGLVCWEKGVAMTTKDILARMKKIQLPYVIHYRISSVGGTCDELCHPFPYGAADLRLSGASKKGVIFHNGTFHTWRRDLKDAAVYSNTPLPRGRWSDSRAMAFMAGIYGTGFMELVEEKVVAFTPEDGPVIFGTLQQGWTFKKLEGDLGIWFSNDRWEKKLPGSRGSNVGAGSGPTVGSFHNTGRSHWRGGQNHTQSGGNTRASDPRFACDPWKKPEDCDHKDGTYTFYNSMRFCGACGIRLDPVKDEPWITANPQADDKEPVGNTTEAATKLLAAAQGAAGPSENIAQRVRRLVLAASIREGRA